MTDQSKESQTPTSEIDKLRAELSEFKQKAEDYLNSWKRTAADFENYKKRRGREDAELLTFAKEITVVKVLPVLEALEQALKQAPQDQRYQQWSAGVLKIVQGLERSLIELGVEKIKTVGEKFNPELHEAVETLNDPSQSGQVLEEIAVGYTINGKVIRPAKVKVAR